MPCSWSIPADPDAIGIAVDSKEFLQLNPLNSSSSTIQEVNNFSSNVPSYNFALDVGGFSPHFIKLMRYLYIKWYLRSDEIFILCFDQNHDKSNSKYLWSCFCNASMYRNCKLQIYIDSTWAFMASKQQNRNPLRWQMPREVAECNTLVSNLKIDPCKRLQKEIPFRNHHHVQVLYGMCVCVLGIRCPRLIPKCVNYHVGLTNFRINNNQELFV